MYGKSISKKPLIYVLSILVIIVTANTAFADEIPQQVLDWQAAASDFEKSGDFAKAVAEYEKIIQGYPNTPYGLEACAKTANLYIKQKQFANLQPLVVQICTSFQEQTGVFKMLSGLVTKCMYAEAYPEVTAIITKTMVKHAQNQSTTKLLFIGMMIPAGQKTKPFRKAVKVSLLNGKHRKLARTV